jgi:hypothetical protein
MTRLVLLPLTLVVLVACADATPTGPGSGSGSPSGIAHPTDPDAPILTVTTSGGFVPVEFTFLNAPSFALYGDGTIVVPGAQIAIYPGPALPAMIQRSVDETGIQAILAAAVEAGLERDGDYSDLGQMGIADAGTTTFSLTVDGTTHVVSAYALGMAEERQPGQPEDVWRMREALERFRRRLEVLDWLPAGSLGPERAYTGTSARLLVTPYRADGDLRQEPIAWPLSTGLAGIGEPFDVLSDGGRCAVLEGADWEAVHAAAVQANQRTPWTSDGERFAIAFRPLLPDEDEAGCAPAF